MKSTVISGDSRRPADFGIEPGSVDCIITSPPYWNLKRYGTEVEGEIGHGQTLDAYRDDMLRVFLECHRAASPNGVMWVVVDTMRNPPRSDREYEMLPLPTDLAAVAQEAGWRFQDMVIWRKNKTLPFSGAGKLRNLVEYVLLLTKTRDFKHRPYRLAERHQPDAEWLAGWPERYHPLGRNPSNIWDIAIPTQGMWAQTERLHFCPLPSELVRRCIDLTTDRDDVVFDPFAGIGTVPAQAEAMGRRGLGIELNPTFIEIFSEKTRPEFLASWEAAAKSRQLAREDQTDEASLILRLRALKAGKELSRFLERLAQSRPMNHVSAKVQSVIVDPEVDAADCIDVLSGRCDPLKVRLCVLADLTPEQAEELRGELVQGLETEALRSLSLDLRAEITPTSAVDEQIYLRGDDTATRPLFEFDLSRHGAFTSRPIEGLFAVAPRLLTTIELEAPLHPGTPSPLDQARAAGEKKLLESLLGSGMSLDTMAGQLRIPRVVLETLLQTHGLAPVSRAFSVALPDALTAKAERLQR